MRTTKPCGLIWWINFPVFIIWAYFLTISLVLGVFSAKLQNPIRLLKMSCLRCGKLYFSVFFSTPGLMYEEILILKFSQRRKMGMFYSCRARILRMGVRLSVERRVGNIPYCQLFWNTIWIQESSGSVQRLRFCQCVNLSHISWQKLVHHRSDSRKSSDYVAIFLSYISGFSRQDLTRKPVGFMQSCFLWNVVSYLDWPLISFLTSRPNYETYSSLSKKFSNFLHLWQNHKSQKLSKGVFW